MIQQGIINKFNQLTEDTGPMVSRFNQFAAGIKELAISKYGEIPPAAARPIVLEGKKAVFNSNFFEWVDRNNSQSTKAPVKPTKEGSSSFYQLTDQSKLEANDRELDKFLMDFLTPFGVESQELADYKERFGKDSLGVTDVLNKLIFYSENRNVETVPEEFGHMLSFLMGPEHPIMKELLSEIINWEEYDQIHKDYYAIYDYNDAKVRLEAIGKLIAKRLVAQKTQPAKSKLMQLVDKVIDKIMLAFSKIYKSGYYSRYLADKIAAQVLMGNRDFVYEGYQKEVSKREGFKPVSFQEALNANPHAKNIFQNFGVKYSNPLVGSLGIAGQGEQILRTPGEPIHDLDFTVESISKFTAMQKNLQGSNVAPIHFGWSNDNKIYTTYSYFITPEGYTVKVLERTQSGWTARDSKGNYRIEVRDKNGNVVEATPENVMPVDFFVYPDEAPFTGAIVDGKFSSWQDTFFGKLTLSNLGERETMFRREKDQVDYIMNNPVNRNVRPNPAFMFYQLDTQRNTIDPTEVAFDKKLEMLHMEQLKSLNNRKKELKQIAAGVNRLEIEGRIDSIERSIEELGKKASVTKLFNVAFYDITTAKKILKKSFEDTTPFDINELVRILSVLEGFDNAMQGIITTPEEKKYVLTIRNAYVEMNEEFTHKLIHVVERIARREGFDISYEELTKAYKDLTKTESVLWSPEESHIPILRIAASVLNQYQADIRDEDIAFDTAEKELRDKFKNYDFSQIIEDGHLVLPYLESYYTQEAKLNKDISIVKQEIADEYKKAEEQKRDPNQARLSRLYSKLRAFNEIKFDWYKNNNTYYLSPLMEERYKADLERMRDRCTDPITGEFDQEEFDAFVKENSPYQNQAGKLTNDTVEIEGQKLKVFNVTADRNPKGRWFRYLTTVPKTGGKVDWSNPRYEQVKNDEMYQFIVKSFAQSLGKVPHELYADSSGPHKFLRKIHFDATDNSFAFRSWGKDVLNMVKDWTTIELAYSDIEEKYTGITDFAGREKAAIKTPSATRIKGAKDPLDLAKKFHKLATAYEYKTKVVPITDTLQYTLSQMDALRANTVTGKMYETMIEGMKNQPEVVKQGLINAQRSLKYKVDSVLSERTRLDEQSIEVTPEERAALREAEKLWVEGGMEGPRPTIRKISGVAIADSITDFTRLNLIGLKPFTAAANLIMGMSSTFMYAARNKEFNDDDAWRASKLLWGSLLKFSHKSKMASPTAIKISLLAEKMGIVTNLFESQGEQKSRTAENITKIMYLMQERGEYTIHTHIMLSMMMAQKVTDLKGKQRNLWEAYTTEKDSQGNYFLSWNEKEFGKDPLWQSREVFDSSNLNISKIKKFEADLRRIRIATQGDYMNALLGKSVWAGRLGFLFRTWLPSAIRQRFGKEIEGEFKGRYKTYWSYAKNSYKRNGLVGVVGNTLKTAGLATLKTFNILPFNYLGMGAISKAAGQSYENHLKEMGLSTIDVENMRANVRELQFVLFVALLTGALKQLDDDDDDPELTFLINLGERTYQDFSFFMNPNSAMSIIKDPIPIWKTMQDAVDVTVAIENRISDPEADVYQRGYRKGQSKVAKEFIDLFPGWSGIRSTFNMANYKFGTQSYKYR